MKSSKDFILTDGKVTIDNSKIFIDSANQKLSRKFRDLLLYALVIVSFIDRIDKYEELSSTYDVIKTLFFGLATIVVIYFIVQFIFRHNWNSKLDINSITSVEIEDDGNEVEVLLINTSKRKKTINFRKLENQVEPFLEILKKRNSRLVIKRT